MTAYPDEPPRAMNCAAIRALHELQMKQRRQINDLMAIECEDAEGESRCVDGHEGSWKYSSMVIIASGSSWPQWTVIGLCSGRSAFVGHSTVLSRRQRMPSMSISIGQEGISDVDRCGSVSVGRKPSVKDLVSDVLGTGLRRPDHVVVRCIGKKCWAVFASEGSLVSVAGHYV